MRRVFVASLICSTIFLGVALSYHSELSKKDPPSGLTVVFPNLHFEKSWDISDGSSLWSIFILNNIVETLVRVGNNSDVKPALSDGWSFSEDKKVLSLSLSDKYTFHDGTSITPEDIILSLKRSLSSPKMKHSEVYKSLLNEKMDESIVLKGNSIEIRLKEPLNALIYQLSVQEMGIAPRDYISKSPKESLRNLSGPYQIIDFTPQKMSLKRHPSHPLLNDDSPAQVDIVEINNMREAIKYYNEQEDVILIGSDYAKSLKYLDLEGKKYLSAFALTEFFLPNIDSERLNSTEKRQVIFSLIKKAFSEVTIDERVAERTNQIFTKNNISRLSEENLKEIYNTPLFSQKMQLDVLILGFMKDNPIPSLLKDKLKELNIDLNLIVSDYKKNAKFLQEKKYDLLYVYSGVSALDPIVEMIYLFNHPLSNFSYDNEELKTFLDQAKKELDRKKYVSLLKEIHLGLLKKYRILPLMHTKMVYCAKGRYELKEMNYFDGSFNLWDWHQK